MIRKLLTFSAASVLIFISSGLSAENSSVKKQEIADSLFKIYLMGGDHLGYSTEVLDFLKKKYNIFPEKDEGYSSYNQRESDDKGVDYYSLLSGGLAIRESLQLNTIKAGIESAGSVNIKTLVAPKVNSHPYAEMMKGREYKMFAMDICIPAEFYSVHFSNTTKALDFFDYLNDVGGSLHNRYTMTPVDFNIKEKIMTQLALKENKEARLFYSSVIEEMSITGSDPFVIEGTDVTLVMKIRSPVIFNATVGMYRSEFKKKFNAEVRTVNISGVEGEYITADYRRVNSVLVKLPDNIVIISNSVKGAERVVETYQKKRPALADAPDYKYMRSIYKGNPDSEDGFVYLSEAFIRHLVSPELRIKEARRMAGAVKLAALERFIIYSYQLNGKMPANTGEVLSTMEMKPLPDRDYKILESITAYRLHQSASEFYADEMKSWDSFNKALQYYDNDYRVESKKIKDSAKEKKLVEERIHYLDLLKKFYLNIKGTSPKNPAEVFTLLKFYTDARMNYNLLFKDLNVVGGSFSAVHSTFGRMGYMTPNCEIETGSVTNGEAESYRKFAEEYTSYWKEYFDPIGVRFKLEDGGISVDTCILPLIDNSIYTTLKEIFGGKPVELHPGDSIKGDILSAAFKVNMSKLTGEMDLFRNFGGYDSENRGQNHFSEIFGDEIQIHMGDVTPMIDIDGSTFIREFMRGGASSREITLGFIAWSFFHPMRIAIPVKKPDAALKVIDSIAGYGRSNSITFSKYSMNYSNVKVDVMKINYFGIATSRIFYCIKDSMLHVATTEKYIRDLIDSGKSPEMSVKKNIAAVFRPSEMVLEKNSYSSGIIESALDASRKNNGTIKLLSGIFTGAKSEELPDLAYKNFGFKPVCPMGGFYSIDKNGNVVNSVYGNSYDPVVSGLDGDSGTSAVLKRFFSTKEIRLEFEFTPEGIKTLVKTK